jgi:hypothetical protein
MQYQVLDNWLGREDSNLRMAESKSAALPLGYAPMPLLSQAAAGGGLDHIARRDRPQPLLTGETKITMGGQFNRGQPPSKRGL